jgi:hypothetical protein
MSCSPIQDDESLWEGKSSFVASALVLELRPPPSPTDSLYEWRPSDDRKDELSYSLTVDRSLLSQGNTQGNTPTTHCLLGRAWQSMAAHAWRQRLFNPAASFFTSVPWVPRLHVAPDERALCFLTNMPLHMLRMHWEYATEIFFFGQSKRAVDRQIRNRRRAAPEVDQEWFPACVQDVLDYFTACVPVPQISLVETPHLCLVVTAQTV